MAEKRVSVRLSAVGGKQVRAELEGVGDAGVKGFGRLSSEMEKANARLAAFSARVKIAAAAAMATAAAIFTRAENAASRALARSISEDRRPKPRAPASPTPSSSARTCLPPTAASRTETRFSAI